MEKSQFFNAIRTFVNNNAVEPRPGFVANNLSITVGNFEFSIEGRNRGLGYVTVREGGVIVLDECVLHPVFPELINWRIIMVVFAGARPQTAKHAHLADGAGNCTVCLAEVAWVMGRRCIPRGTA